MSSIFAGLVTAQKALYASQAALNITGQNISNVNTSGYTRQRVDLYSSPSGGYSSRYSSKISNSIGQGVDIGGFSQIRDPFLDIRFRTESCKLGEIDAELSFLTDLEKIFDEISVDGINAQFQDLKAQLQALASESGSPEFESIVKSSAENLIKLFNQYSSELNGVFDQQLKDFDNVGIDKVNTLLQNIAHLNKTIKEDELHGNPALELRDQRNSMLDELSQYMDIKVNMNKVQVAENVYLEELSISLPDGTTILQDGTYGQLERNADMDQVGDKLQVNLKYPHDAATAVDITDKINSGTIKGYLTMFNSSGSFDTPPTNDKGIGYYNALLNSLAQSFADTMNSLNSFDGTESNAPADPNDYDRPLFSTSDGSGTITAGNICLSEGWLNNQYGITNSKEGDMGTGDNSGKNDNILNMIAAFDKKIEFKTPGGTTVFTGTFEQFFSNTSVVLGTQKNATESLFKNYYSTLTGINDSRAGISTVSLDEEGVNLLRYQKSYNAAARLMTTLDQALDTIINNMGVVGR